MVTDDSNLNRIICDEDWPLIRYTNIWLLYAEALNEDGRLGDAISVVNRIRERAHMPLLTNGGSGYNAVMGKEDMRKRIQYERRVELCAEGINFLDEGAVGNL